MAYDVYSTSFLLGAYGVIDRPKAFIYQTFFKSEYQFETQEVYFDRVQRARRLAPLVAPLVEGKAEKLRGYQTSSFLPAYVKAMHVIEPNRLLKRRPGEALVGSMSLQERRDAIIMDTLQIQDYQITRREEYMAIQMMLTGTVTVASADYPAQVVDMQRPAANTIVLSGPTAWGQAGVDAHADLNLWAAQVAASSGFMPTVVVMDPKAYILWMQSPSAQRLVTSFNAQSGGFNQGGTAVGGVGTEARQVAQAGIFSIWVYQQFYTDANGNQIQYMPDNTVIMADPDGCEGSRLYGAIQDMRSLAAASRFPKMWVQENPSAEFMMTQSAPLPIIGWPQATLAATVA